jgi:hypothetical protein
MSIDSHHEWRQLNFDARDLINRRKFAAEMKVSYDFVVCGLGSSSSA